MAARRRVWERVRKAVPATVFVQSKKSTSPSNRFGRLDKPLVSGDESTRADGLVLRGPESTFEAERAEPYLVQSNSWPAKDLESVLI